MREVKPLELGRTLRGNGKALAEDGKRGGRRAAGWFNMRGTEDDDQRKYAKRRGGRGEGTVPRVEGGGNSEYHGITFELPISEKKYHKIGKNRGPESINSLK